MERQLDASAGYLLQKQLEDRGIKVMVKANTKQIIGNGKVEGVELSDGTIVPCTLVVMAVGIRPNAALAREAGLASIAASSSRTACRRPIQPSLPLANVPRSTVRSMALLRRSTTWPVCWAAQLTGDASRRLQAGRYADQAQGHWASISIRSATLPKATTARNRAARCDSRLYKRLVLKDNRIIGTVLYARTG